MNSAPQPADHADAHSSPSLRTCSECGSAVAERSLYCDVCGARLNSTVSEHPTVAEPAPSRNPRRTAGRDLLFAALYITALAALLYIVTTPEEVKGPPIGRTGMPQEGAMPHGHPATDDTTTAPVKLTPTLPPVAIARLEHAADSMENVLKNSPGNDSARLRLANIYYDLDKHPQAVKLYREYLTKNPKDLGARTDMAVSLASINDYDAAINELRSVLHTDPKFQMAAFNVAMVHMFRREKDSTIAWLRRTVEIDASSGPGRNASEILQGLEQAHAPEGM